MNVYARQHSAQLILTLLEGEATFAGHFAPVNFEVLCWNELRYKDCNRLLMCTRYCRRRKGLPPPRFFDDVCFPLFICTAFFCDRRIAL